MFSPKDTIYEVETRGLLLFCLLVIRITIHKLHNFITCDCITYITVQLYNNLGAFVYNVSYLLWTVTKIYFWITGGIHVLLIGFGRVPNLYTGKCGNHLRKTLITWKLKRWEKLSYFWRDLTSNALHESNTRKLLELKRNENVVETN